MTAMTLPTPTAEPAITRCFHCGEPVPTGADWPIHEPGGEHAACCAGCQAVAQAIFAAGLGDYYRHRTAPATRAETGQPDWLEQLRMYDLPAIQNSFVHTPAEHQSEAALVLEGISCAACVWLNEQHLGRLPGVLSVQVNYSTLRARVRWDTRQLQLSDILKAIADIGYRAHPFDAARQESLQQQERRTALRRLFVAGFGMMQVMMYAVPTYLAGGDMTADIEQLMRLASLLLTLPVVTYAAHGFHLGAWRDLRRGRVGMDVPVVLGIWSAFLASLWATWRGGDVYYDSVTMFVFFLLGGRYLEMIVRARANRAVEALGRLLPAVARRINTADTTLVPVAELQPGDLVLVKPGESFPADGRVLAGRSTANEAMLTGESRPLQKQPGDSVTGGTINLDSPLQVTVERIGEATAVAGILRLIDRASAEKPPIALLADQVAGHFVTALLLISAATALGWLWLEPAHALAATVAVLVVSCPCALSLATPAALTAATSRLTQDGLLVVRGHALEGLARVSHWVFDKTGTLTLGELRLLDSRVYRDLSPEHALALAAALESASEHPLARAFATAAPTAALAACDIRNTPGYGVAGCVDGRQLRLGRAEFVCPDLPVPAVNGNDSVVWLGDDQGWLAQFTLGDTLRPDALSTVQALQAAGIQVSLLSGDRAATVAAVARQLGIAEWRGDLTPADKLAAVAALQAEGAVVAMTGDGINDAPVLAAAQVSVALAQGTEAAQCAADLVLTGDRLTPLARGLHTARATRRVIRQNLTWALLYNLIALPLAIAGWVTPWLAGLGMSGSSLLVVVNAWRLSRR